MTPRLPPEGLLLITLGGLWLCLWRGNWRRWGIVAIVAGFASMMLTRPPDIVIADGGRFVAARAPDGHYFASADRGEKIVRAFLASETGAAFEPWPATGNGAESGLDCAADLCRYTARGRTVAIVTAEAALPLKCGAVDAIVSQVPAGFRCRSVIPVIDRIDLAAAAARTDQPLFPFEDSDLGPIASRKLGRIGLNPAAAIPAPHDQANPSGRRAA